MPNKKNVRIPPRAANHESLQKQYADASVPHHKRWGVNAILSLYETGYIYTKRAAERQINNFIKSSSNPKLQQEAFMKTLRKYYNKPPTRQGNRISKLMERGDALAREVEGHALVHKVEKRDSDRPFSHIDLHLRTQAAFPNMPDLEDRGETDLEESFEKGEPHKDVQMTTLIRS